CVFFFFNDTATTEIYTLSLHDALPILCVCLCVCVCSRWLGWLACAFGSKLRSEEHTSALQLHLNLVCRLLLAKKKKRTREQRSRCTAAMIQTVLYNVCTR